MDHNMWIIVQRNVYLCPRIELYCYPSDGKWAFRKCSSIEFRTAAVLVWLLAAVQMLSVDLKLNENKSFITTPYNSSIANALDFNAIIFRPKFSSESIK